MVPAKETRAVLVALSIVVFFISYAFFQDLNLAFFNFMAFFGSLVTLAYFYPSKLSNLEKFTDYMSKQFKKITIKDISIPIIIYAVVFTILYLAKNYPYPFNAISFLLDSAFIISCFFSGLILKKQSRIVLTAIITTFLFFLINAIFGIDKTIYLLPFYLFFISLLLTFIGCILGFIGGLAFKESLLKIFLLGGGIFFILHILMNIMVSQLLYLSEIRLTIYYALSELILIVPGFILTASLFWISKKEKVSLFRGLVFGALIFSIFNLGNLLFMLIYTPDLIGSLGLGFTFVANLIFGVILAFIAKSIK